MRSKLVAGLVVGTCLASLVGCAAFRAAAARNAHIHEQTQAFVYDKPLAQVWPHARTLLFQQGYQVKNTGEGSFTLETDWKFEGSNHNKTSSTSASTRYLVQGIELDGGKSQVIFTKNTRSTSYGKMGANNDHDSTRDLEIEWMLIQQVEPQRASEIASEADSKAQAARQAS